VLDVARCIDYLDTRRDVDREHLGVMGNSSGGTTALYAAALLPRLTMAMPSCAFCTFRACLLSIKHCLCNYVPDLYNHVDMADILGCLAPKPVVVVHGHEDEIFPIAATQAAFSRLREIYAAAGAEGHCRLVIGEGGHRFYAEEAWPVVEELTGTVSQ
jgi:dienelactone hydrolase